MTKTRFFCLLFLLCHSFIILTSAYASSPNFSKSSVATRIPVEPPPAALTVGEHIEMEVSWLGIPVGIGTLDVKEMVERNGRKAYHVIAVARTNEFLSKLYPVCDEIHSYIDAERFCSLEFSKKVQEGRYRADECIVYDYKERKGYWRSLKNGSEKTVELPPTDVHDPISALYWFRLQPIEPGKSLHLTANDEEKNWDLEIRMLGLEDKELRGGKTLHTVLVEPKTRLRGMLVERGRLWVWFTTDQKRLPVCIRMQTPYGPVTAVIKEL